MDEKKTGVANCQYRPLHRGCVRGSGCRCCGLCIFRLGGCVMEDRESRALSYINNVHERRKLRATWIITGIEIVMLAYSILLAVAIYKGGGTL